MVIDWFGQLRPYIYITEIIGVTFMVLVFILVYKGDQKD